jgi:type IV pilus assembly protein PilB
MAFNPLSFKKKSIPSAKVLTSKEESAPFVPPKSTLQTPLPLESQVPAPTLQAPADPRKPLPKQAPAQVPVQSHTMLLTSPAKPSKAQGTDSLLSKTPTPLKSSVPSRRIGDILVERGYLTPTQIAGALSESKATGATLGTIVTRAGYIAEEQLGMCLAELHGMEYIRGKDIYIKPEVVSLIPANFIKTHLVLPHRLDTEAERLEVIIAHPDETRVLDDIALMTRYRVVAKVSTSSEISSIIDQYFATKYVAEELIEALETDAFLNTEEAQEDLSSQEVNADSAPIVQFTNVLLTEAIEKGASDIHLEPQPQRFLIRFRIDGILKEIHSLSIKMAPAIISRLKVMAKLDVSERRRPQDGRLKHAYGSTFVDMRINTIPLSFGEKMVIRVLKMNANSGQLNKLGMDDEDLQRLTQMIYAPHGLVLVTGPTGSGKTTTLYAALRNIASPEHNISTIEDPVEYLLAGINQMQVQPKAGLTFASSLRALLRQDPDVIMLGEIRDAETLEAALQAAMTGHLVLSTVHANSCAKTVARLLDMGAPSYLVSTSVVGIVAQRLVRALCPHCKKITTPSPEDLELLGHPKEGEAPYQIHEAVGCSQCDHSGYKGRHGIYEVMVMNREIAQLIDDGASSVTIEDAAIQYGMKLLLDDAKRLVKLGVTTTKEVRRTLGH